MISIPVAAWIAFNTLGIVSILVSKNSNKYVAFGLSLGAAALSCALLSSGALHLFLGVEIARWLAQGLVVILALAVMPPGSSKDEIGSVAVSSSIRLIAALGVWLWV